MNVVDIVILSVFAISVLIGLWRGLISELLSIVVWIAAFWLSWAFGAAMGEQLRPWIGNESARTLAGHSLCFVLVLVLGALLRVIFRRMLWSTGLSGVDRVLGMGFGFVRGVLVVAVVVFLVGFTGFTQAVWWRQSTLLPKFQGVAIWMGQRVPKAVPANLHMPSGLSMDKLPALPNALPKGLPDNLPASLPSNMQLSNLPDLQQLMRTGKQPSPTPARSASSPDPARVP